MNIIKKYGLMLLITAIFCGLFALKYREIHYMWTLVSAYTFIIPLSMIIFNNKHGRVKK